MIGALYLAVTASLVMGCYGLDSVLFGNKKNHDWWVFVVGLSLVFAVLLTAQIWETA